MIKLESARETYELSYLLLTYHHHHYHPHQPKREISLRIKFQLRTLN